MSVVICFGAGAFISFGSVDLRIDCRPRFSRMGVPESVRVASGRGVFGGTLGRGVGSAVEGNSAERKWLFCRLPFLFAHQLGGITNSCSFSNTPVCALLWFSPADSKYRKIFSLAILANSKA